MACRLVLFRLEDAAHERPDSEDVEPLPGDLGRHQPLGARRGKVVETLFIRGGGGREYLPAVAHVGETRDGNDNAREIQLLVFDPDGEHAGRVRHAGRMQKQPVDHAENHGVGADAERERQHRHGREAGILRQHAQTVSKVR